MVWTNGREKGSAEENEVTVISILKKTSPEAELVL
jgi:hypothetical protein